MGQNVACAETLAATVVCRVTTLSILGHDLTANPFATAYAARAKPDSSLRI
jgi:hypothetical protein